MTARVSWLRPGETRSPYTSLPARPPRFDGALPRAAYEAGGREALRSALRALLVEDAGRRASSPAEIRLLREWIEAEGLPAAFDFWTRRIEGPRSEPEPGVQVAEEPSTAGPKAGPCAPRVARPSSASALLDVLGPVAPPALRLAPGRSPHDHR